MTEAREELPAATVDEQPQDADEPPQADGVTPWPAADMPPQPVRPRAIDLASAILIVTGALGLVAALAFLGGLPPGSEPIFISTVVIGVSSILLGSLIRRGRAWAIALTFAAVLGFLDLTSGGGPLSLLLGLSDILVVGLLLTNRGWFDAIRAWRAALRTAERTPASP